MCTNRNVSFENIKQLQVIRQNTSAYMVHRETGKLSLRTEIKYIKKHLGLILISGKTYTISYQLYSVILRATLTAFAYNLATANTTTFTTRTNNRTIRAQEIQNTHTKCIQYIHQTKNYAHTQTTKPHVKQNPKHFKNKGIKTVQSIQAQSSNRRRRTPTFTYTHIMQTNAHTALTLH